MTDTSREALIRELRSAHAGHSDEGPSTFSDAADMLEADKRKSLSDDKARLDWLDQNIFNRENLNFSGNIDMDYNMWVMFSPRGTQGSARAIIDAAIAHDIGDKP